MANETAKITFYRINQCGFYPWGDDQAAFGSVEDMLTQMQAWSEGKQLAETKTYEPAEGSEQMPCYLLDVTGADDSWLITMWNETPATDGQTASVVGTSNVGNAEVVMNDLPEGAIPGFATYFWFLPDQEVFASVRFQHLITGQKPMQLYMESYLAEYSSHVVLTEPDEGEDIQIAGYRAAEQDPVGHFQPRFRTALFRKTGQHDMLIQEALRIRKVLRKTALSLKRKEDLAQWQQVLTHLHLRKPRAQPELVKIKYEVGTTLTRRGVERLIGLWNEQHERQWDDYGFMLKGDKKIHWLSHSIARKEFELNVDRDNPEVVNATSLLRILNRRRQDILNLTR